MIEFVTTNWYSILLAFMSVIVIRNVGDWFIFNIKAVPKNSIVSGRGWLLGWLCLFLLLVVYFTPSLQQESMKVDYEISSSLSSSYDCTTDTLNTQLKNESDDQTN